MMLQLFDLFCLIFTKKIEIAIEIKICPVSLKSKFKRYTGTDFVPKLFIKQKLAVSLFSIPLVYHKRSFVTR